MTSHSKEVSNVILPQKNVNINYVYSKFVNINSRTISYKKALKSVGIIALAAI
jgi:hypothetical protein